MKTILLSASILLTIVSALNVSHAQSEDVLDNGEIISDTTEIDADTIANTPNAQSCWQAGANWEREAPVVRKRATNIRGNAQFLLFDKAGELCYRSKVSRVTEGDIVNIGVFDDPDVTENYKLEIPNCSLQQTLGRVESPSSIEDIELQSGGIMQVRDFAPFECYDSQLTLNLRDTATNSTKWTQTLRQYERFRGSVQIGVLWTELDDIAYSTGDSNGMTVIRADRDESRGPEYVASLVVYGVPNYFTSWIGGSNYAGRDIVNENGLGDRIGLVLSFGIDKPADTFGVGLSFELAAGINLTGTQLYRRLDILDDGLSVGDEFSGQSIPTKKSWEDEFVLGLSIDTRYIARFFRSAGSSARN